MTISDASSGFSENALQTKLLDALRDKPGRWKQIPLTKSTSGARTLYDLVGEQRFGVDFVLEKEQPLPIKGTPLSVELFHGMKPDLVLWSKLSGQCRIVFEVKRWANLTHKEQDASQLLRYFLYLLVTSDPHPNQKPDIGRGMFLVAPGSWFASKSNAEKWGYFLDHYGPLAKQFDITLGEILAEDF